MSKTKEKCCEVTYCALNKWYEKNLINLVG